LKEFALFYAPSINFILFVFVFVLDYNPISGIKLENQEELGRIAHSSAACKSSLFDDSKGLIAHYSRL